MSDSGCKQDQVKPAAETVGSLLLRPPRREKLLDIVEVAIHRFTAGAVNSVPTEEEPPPTKYRFFPPGYLWDNEQHGSNILEPEDCGS